MTALKKGPAHLADPTHHPQQACLSLCGTSSTTTIGGGPNFVCIKSGFCSPTALNVGFLEPKMVEIDSPGLLPENEPTGPACCKEPITVGVEELIALLEPKNAVGAGDPCGLPAPATLPIAPPALLAREAIALASCGEVSADTPAPKNEVAIDVNGFASALPISGTGANPPNVRIAAADPIGALDCMGDPGPPTGFAEPIGDAAVLPNTEDIIAAEKECMSPPLGCAMAPEASAWCEGGSTSAGSCPNGHSPSAAWRQGCCWARSEEEHVAPMTTRPWHA